MQLLFYTIYQITNILDGKIYIGKHQTNDLNDGYMGSGKLLRRAQLKHGIENFKKEILFQFDDEADMNAKEAEIVTEEFCLRADTYNLCSGGHGGFSYLNRIKTDKERSDQGKKSGKIHAEKLKTDLQYRSTHIRRSVKALSKARESYREKYPKSAFFGRTHSEETRQKMSKSKNVGSSNSQFGTMWITNGQENKKIKKDIDIIPEGWYKGRK